MTMTTRKNIITLAGGGSTLAPNIVRGGKAIDLGNNFYYIKGRKHKNGGVDVGENDKTGLEVEGEEVMQVKPDEVRVFSSVPFLRGVSPAELVMNGNNPDAVFNAQEEYKDRNRLNDDGSKYKNGGRKKAEIGTSKNSEVYGAFSDNNGYGYLARLPEITITGNKNYYLANKWNKEHQQKSSEIPIKAYVDNNGNLSYKKDYKPEHGNLEIVSPEFDILLSAPLIKSAGKFIADKLGFFVQKSNTFTRGIGSKKGLEDLYESGLVRGNPIGTEITAKQFSKITKSNRDNFNDIMRDSGVKNAAIKFNNRELTKDEFYAIKNAAVKYKTESNSILLRQRQPLENYKDYDDYINAIKQDKKTLANATSFDDSGQPLAYFYDDGRNPLTSGHRYAASDYGVRINNVDKYPHRIFEGHIHQSFNNAVPLNNSDVEVFKNINFGPFTFTKRINKNNIANELNKKQYGGNMIASINGNVKNGLIHTEMKCGGRRKAEYGSYDNMLGIGRAYYTLGRIKKEKPIDLKEKEIENIKELEFVPTKKEELETIPIDKNIKTEKPKNIGKVYHNISFDAMEGLLRGVGRKINYNYTRHGNTDFRTADLDNAIFTNRPDTIPNITSIYGNDFVYDSPETASARRVKDFKNQNAKDIDGRIPVSNISRYYGTDKNGKFKIGALTNFDDNDYVAAIRNKSMPFDDVAIENGKLIYYKDGKPIKSSLPEGENNKHIVYNPITGKKQFVSTVKDINKLYKFYKQFLSNNEGYADIVLLDNGRFEDNIYKGGRNLTDDEISDYYRNDFRRKGTFTSVPVIVEGNMKKYGGRKKANWGISYFAPSLFGPKYDKVIDLNANGRSERNLLYADATNPNRSFADILLSGELDDYSGMGNFSNRRIKGYRTIRSNVETPAITPTPNTPTTSAVSKTSPTSSPVEDKSVPPHISRTSLADTLKIRDNLDLTPNITKDLTIKSFPWSKQQSNTSNWWDNNLDKINLYTNLGASTADFITSTILNSQLPTYSLPTMTAPTLSALPEIKLADIKEIEAPKTVAVAKLKTRYNANPQLSKIEDETRRNINDIDRNTADSRVALARKQRARIASQEAKNQVYGQKENIETELINKDKLNAQAVAQSNAASYNNYLAAKAQQAMGKAQLQMMVDKANIGNKLAVDQFNANAKLTANQFNTNNKIKEILGNNAIETTKLNNYAQGVSNLLGNIGGSIDTFTKNSMSRKRDAEALKALRARYKDIPDEILNYIIRG